MKVIKRAVSVAVLVFSWCSSSSYAADSNLIGAPLPSEPKSDSQFYLNWAACALWSAPAEKKISEPTAMEQTTSVNIQIDDKGELKSIQFGRLSDSQSRDIWTLWATATCPPQKPKGISSPVLFVVDNAPSIAANTQDEEQARTALYQSMKSKSGILVPLIPLSLAHVYPKIFSAAELSGKANLVELANDALPSSKTWNKVSANKWIEQNHQLLFEWQHFFTKHPNAPKKEYLMFASELRKKYKKILK